jgi:hypothetical protein
LRNYSADGLLQQFSWVQRAYPQYHAIMYVLWHLCVRPSGPDRARAWEAAEALLEKEMQDEAAMGFSSMSAVLAALRAKAMAAREKVEGREAEGDGEVADGEVADGGVVGQAQEDGRENNVTSTSGSFVGADDLGLDGSGADDWPAWEVFFQAGQLDAANMFWQ